MTARSYTILEIARAIGGEVSGDPDIRIHRVRSIEAAGEGDIAIAGDPRIDAARLRASRAAAVVVPRGMDLEGRNLIHVEQPRDCLIPVLRLFDPPRELSGLDDSATIAPSAIIGDGAYVGPGAVIGERARIGAGAQVHAHCVVSDEVVLGAGSVLFPSVVLYSGTEVGERVTIHSGTVIGSDGFGYRRLPDGEQEKVPHLGRVVIEDEVEIGANCAIDRATLEETRIGRGTKIDNLVQIGHNSEIGSHACILGQVGISGSVRIGSFSIIAGQAGIADHVKIGEGTVVGAQAGVHHDLNGGRWLNTPAWPAERVGRIMPILEHLPEYRERFRQLERRCQDLEKKLEQLIADLTAAQRR
jgi:UDP-3-O-[3-hydroxymyristoyl] glucosamine N-acyltransferase